MPAAQKKGAGCSKRLILGRPSKDRRTREFLEVASFMEENDDEHININDLLDLLDIPFYNRVRHGTNSFSFLVPKIWNNLSEENRTLSDLPSFRIAIATGLYTTIDWNLTFFINTSVCPVPSSLQCAFWCVCSAHAHNLKLNLYNRVSFLVSPYNFSYLLTLILYFNFYIVT